jgi:hypothetical protein
MAKYTSNLTTSVMNKMGGVVFSQSGAHRTLRSLSVPRRSSTPRSVATTAVPQQALDAWQAMDVQINTYWALFTGWWYSQRDGGQPKYHDPYTLFQQCFSNAYQLGATLPTSYIETEPAPPPNILTVDIRYDGADLTATAFPDNGHAMSTPWLLFVEPSPYSYWDTVQQTAGASMAGSHDGSPLIITDAHLNAFGTLPAVNSFSKVRAVSLYPGWFATYSQTTLMQVVV